MSTLFNKAAIAERFIRHAKAEVDKAVMEKDLRCSGCDWAQVYALGVFYDEQITNPNVVLGVQGSKAVGAGMMETKMKVPVSGRVSIVGHLPVASERGTIKRENMDGGPRSGQQSKASGNGRRNSIGSHGSSTRAYVGSQSGRREGQGSQRTAGSWNDGFDGTEEEEEDYMIEGDSRPKKTNGNNTAVKIIEREKKKKGFSGPSKRPRHRIGHTSSAIAWICSFDVYCFMEGVPKDSRWELLKRGIGNNESFADWYLECKSMEIEEDWEQVVRLFLKKYASDEEADASLLLQTLTTFARKPNERVQEYADRWNHKVHIQVHQQFCQGGGQRICLSQPAR
ncbi:hypothetical protein HDV00_011212 [Rhizophlyctis rosea]|nr:hypothetical protein HDV00_011212 [Rhizophlyctis rosea]